MRLLAAALLAACSTAPLPAFSPPPPGGRATLFVHGYKGSFLADARGHRVWIEPQDALFRGDRSLALPLELHPDGPMTQLSLLGFKETVYLPFLEFGRESLPGFSAFAYDWRQDQRESGQQLCAAIAALPAAQVDLLVHSMGGLVALYCLRQGAPKVRRVVFFGTPFAGAEKIRGDLEHGDSAGRNKALLSAEAVRSFPSARQLLPPGDPELRAFTPGVPTLVVIGTGHATPPGEDGDGLVTVASATPGFPHRALKTPAGHLEMLGDPRVQSEVRRFLTSEEPARASRE